jgi:hypothetical protein
MNKYRKAFYCLNWGCAMIDMNVFLAEKDGVKLAMKAPFWHAATEIMWQVPTADIRKFLRDNGWIYKEITAAMSTHIQVEQSKTKCKKEEIAFQQAIAGKNMGVFLVVDENGEKLATNSPFWRVATPEMWAVPTKLIREFMRKNGWCRKEIEASMLARRGQTPEGKREKIEYYNANRENILQQRKDTDAKEKRNERERERYENDPEYRLARLLGNTVNKAFAFLEQDEPTDEQLEYYNQRTMEIVECTFDEFKYHISSKFKISTGLKDMGKYNYKTHAKNPTYELDHGFPIAIAKQNKIVISGLYEFLNNYRNLSPIDAKFNKIKKYHIILELIHPDCPGYPFTDGLIGVKRIYATIDEFLADKGYNRSDFPLL